MNCDIEYKLRSRKNEDYERYPYGCYFEGKVVSINPHKPSSKSIIFLIQDIIRIFHRHYSNQDWYKRFIYQALKYEDQIVYPE